MILEPTDGTMAWIGTESPEHDETSPTKPALAARGGNETAPSASAASRKQRNAFPPLKMLVGSTSLDISLISFPSSSKGIGDIACSIAGFVVSSCPSLPASPGEAFRRMPGAARAGGDSGNFHGGYSVVKRFSSLRQTPYIIPSIPRIVKRVTSRPYILSRISARPALLGRESRRPAAHERIVLEQRPGP
jgi:hypothetical protein